MSDKKIQAIADTIKDFIQKSGDVQSLKTLITELEDIKSRALKRNLAFITTAIDLTQEQKQALEASLAKRFNRQLNFEYQLEPAILGGLRIQLDDQIIDLSLNKTLQEIVYTLKH